MPPSVTYRMASNTAVSTSTGIRSHVIRRVCASSSSTSPALIVCPADRMAAAVLARGAMPTPPRWLSTADTTPSSFVPWS